MRFLTGTHKAAWLADPRADFPLFVSHRTLATVKALRQATHSWALDSGGFTELSTYGEWRTTSAIGRERHGHGEARPGNR